MPDGCHTRAAVTSTGFSAWLGVGALGFAGWLGVSAMGVDAWDVFVVAFYQVKRRTTQQNTHTLLSVSPPSFARCVVFG